MNPPTLVAIPADWGEVVPLPIVAREAGIQGADLYNVISRGFLKPVKRGKHGVTLLSYEDACQILAAASLAMLSGIAFASALRVIKTGVIPLPSG